MVNQTINREGGATPQWLLRLAIILSYILIVTAAVFLRLQLASGFGFDVLGWLPPNTEEFRRTCGIAIICTLVLAAIPNSFVWARGKGTNRAMAVGSPLFVGLLFIVAFNL
jgi:hypothetical protein